jgi:hypothetical protein
MNISCSEHSLNESRNESSTEKHEISKSAVASLKNSRVVNKCLKEEEEQEEEGEKTNASCT